MQPRQPNHVVVNAQRRGVEVINNFSVFDANGRELVHFDALGQPSPPQVIVREVDDTAVVVTAVVIAVALAVIFWPT